MRSILAYPIFLIFFVGASQANDFHIIEKPHKLSGFGKCLNKAIASLVSGNSSSKGNIFQKFASGVDQSLGKRVARVNKYKISNLLYVPAHHEQALIFSKLASSLPEIDLKTNPIEMAQAMVNFSKQIPDTHRLIRDYTGPLTGLKYTLYETKVAPKELVVSFAATKDLNDWIANLSFGVDQITHPEINRLLKLIGDQTDVEKIMITGHSLGGGLSQGFSYRLHDYFKHSGADLKDLPEIEVVSFNSLGGKHQIELLPGNSDRQILTQMNASHYYTTGDYVSSISQHVGRLPDEIKSQIESSDVDSSIATLKLVPDNTNVGWVQHRMDQLEKNFRNALNPEHSMFPGVDHPIYFPNSLMSVITNLRPLVLDLRYIYIEQNAVPIAKRIVSARKEYLKQTQIRGEAGEEIYKDWLVNEINDLTNFFISTQNQAGLDIISLLSEPL